MVVGPIFILTSVTLAILVPFLRRERSHDQDGNSVYRYSKKFGKFFLFMIPLMAGMMGFIWSTDPHPLHGKELVAFSVASGIFIGIPVFGYAYAERYQVAVDARGITVISLFGVHRVEFADIAEVATMRGNGVDYWLFSANSKCIAKIGGSVDDFSSLQHEVELRTRSIKVMLYDWKSLQGWQECSNDGKNTWRKSKGPPLIRDRNRRVNIEMVVGAVFVGGLVFVLWRMGLLH
jgi:hypothetical protein